MVNIFVPNVQNTEVNYAIQCTLCNYNGIIIDRVFFITTVNIPQEASGCHA